jgi:hypothetical protein
VGSLNFQKKLVALVIFFYASSLQPLHAGLILDNSSYQAMIEAMNNLTASVAQLSQTMTRGEAVWSNAIPNLVAASSNISGSLQGLDDSLWNTSSAISTSLQGLDTTLRDVVDLGNSITADVDYYAPKLLDLATSLSGTFKSFLSLAEKNAPQAQDSLALVADALTRLADFVDVLQENKIAIACTAAAVIVSSLVIGKLINTYIVTKDKKRNAIYRLYRFTSDACSSCYQWCFPAHE